MKYLHYFENETEDENFDEFKDDVKKVFENDKWIVIKPNSFEAFCYYGQDQGWNDVEYNRKYNFSNDIYININKNDNTKIVLNFDRADFYTEDDDTIYLKDFLDDNTDLLNFYGDILNCDKIVKEGNNYWLVLTDYSDFADFFKTGRDISEKFIKGVLGFDSFEFFQYDNTNFDIDDYGIEVNEDNLLMLKVLLILEKFNNEDEYDYDLDDINDYDDIVSIVKEYDLDELKSMLKNCICTGRESADADKAFDELKDAAYYFFNLDSDSGSTKWQHHNNSKDPKLWIKFKSKSDANTAKFILNKYDDSYDDEMIDYSPPYYGYDGDTENKNEVFNTEIPERITDYDSGNVNGKLIDEYVDIWKDLKIKNSGFTDDELYADFEIHMNTRKYGL